MDLNKRITDLNRLRTLHAVAKAGGVSYAAEELGILQPSITRQLQALEKELGIPLFERKYRGMALTNEGSMLFEVINNFMHDLEDTLALMCENEEEPQGQLRIVATMGVINIWMMRYVTAFMEEYPKIKIGLIGEDRDIIGRLADCDAAIGPFIPHREDLIQKHLLSYHLKLYASPKYLDKFGYPKKLSDLDNHRLIAFYSDKPGILGNVDWILTVGCKDGKKRTPYLQVNSSIGLLQAAVNGIGIICFGVESIDYYQEADLVDLFPGISGHVVDYYYIYKEKYEKLKKIICFYEFLKEKIGELNIKAP